MNQRLTITLSAETVRLMDRTISKGERSRLIDDAIREYVVRRESKECFEEDLAEEARQCAEQDLEIAAEWFPLEEEVAVDY